MKTVRSFSRNVRLLLVAQATIGVGLQGLFYLLINLYLLRLGYNVEFVGIFAAAGVLAIALFSMPATAIGNRIGSRCALILAMVLSSLGLGAMLLSELLPRGVSAAWLITTYALTWIGGTLNLVNSAPFLMANSGPAERNHVFAVYTATQPLAAVVGALVGGLLPALLAGLMGVGPGDPAPYRYTLALAVPCFLTGLVAVTLTTELPQPQLVSERASDTGTAAASTRSPESAFPYGLIAIMMLIAFFKIFGEITTRSFITAYLDDTLHAPTSLIGALYALAQLLAVPAALAAPLLIRRSGLGRIMPLSIVGISASMLPLALVAAVAPAAFGLFGVLMAAALSLASLNLFHQQLVEPHWRTAMSGSVTMASAAGMTTVSVVGGFAIAAWGYNAFFLATGVLTLVAPLLYWGYFRRSQRSLSPAETVGAEAVRLPRA